MPALETLINDAFARRDALSSAEIEDQLRPALKQVLDLLESGVRRVAEPDDHGGWMVNAWLKKAVLLSFRINDNHVVDGGAALAFDKVPLRFRHGHDVELQQLGARVVPGALVRRGAHIARDAVLMPSYVNIGAFVGAGSMVDTWATVGSCAQIGAGVHLSGGVGIGGVLEPLQAAPTIIELGPQARMPVRFVTSTSAACMSPAAPPSSAKPELMIRAFFTPALALSSKAGATPVAGIATKARSTGSPTAAIEGWQRRPSISW